MRLGHQLQHGISECIGNSKTRQRWANSADEHPLWFVTANNEPSDAYVVTVQDTEPGRDVEQPGRRECGLNLKRPDIHTSIEDPYKTRPTLIVLRWWREVRVRRVYGRAARKQLMGEGRAAIVQERSKDWIGVDLIAIRVQQPAAIITTQVVARRND